MGVSLCCEGSKTFFFEKKNQKTFSHVGCGDADATARKDRKFFSYFFQKRSAFLRKQGELAVDSPTSLRAQRSNPSFQSPRRERWVSSPRAQ
jgi:hypothetical protein